MVVQAAGKFLATGLIHYNFLFHNKMIQNMKSKIQSWKNADALTTPNNPASDIIVDDTIMSRVVGGRQAGTMSEDFHNPDQKFIDALTRAISLLRYI